ncbi:MAG: GNAT family N-acetyltransferase [Holophaga sp.]
MSTHQDDAIQVRPAVPEDAPECGRICYAAFSAINQAHGFPCDFPGPEMAVGLLSTLFADPGFHCVVAVREGRILGSNCLDERSPIAGLGPVTVDPQVQDRGVGRRLMRAAMDQAAQRGAAGVRLVQAAFHNRSLSLYASLGFEVREPLSCMQGRTRQRSVPGCAVRAAQSGDLAAASALCRRVHGFERLGELAAAIRQGEARVVERDGRITGYATAMAFFGHAVAETVADLQALVASAEGFAGPGILVPSRQTALFHWCLEQGLRVVQPMTLMSTGLYSEPAGAWLPSISY